MQMIQMMTLSKVPNVMKPDLEPTTDELERDAVRAPHSIQQTVHRNNHSSLQQQPHDRNSKDGIRIKPRVSSSKKTRYRTIQSVGMATRAHDKKMRQAKTTQGTS